MNCIIIDDEPLAREAIKALIDRMGSLIFMGAFNNAVSASDFLKSNAVDLIFLDIQMPYINGLEFARTISKDTLVIFTTAYAEYALDSYEVEAIDYLVKPVNYDRFQKAVQKAATYHSLLLKEEKEKIEDIENQYVYVRSERRLNKVNLADILFIEGLKDYVIIHLLNERIITKINLKNIHEKLPQAVFMRVNKSYIVNTQQIDSLDNNSIHIGSHAITIGDSYRESFFDRFEMRKL